MVMLFGSNRGPALDHRAPNRNRRGVSGFPGAALAVLDVPPALRSNGQRSGILLVVVADAGLVPVSRGTPSEPPAVPLPPAPPAATIGDGYDLGHKPRRHLRARRARPDGEGRGLGGAGCRHKRHCGCKLGCTLACELACE